ncbi:MAG: hypothetical protein ACJARI_004168 [Bacteroidia bacterium]|jgi:hypothetical protein
MFATGAMAQETAPAATTTNDMRPIRVEIIESDGKYRLLRGGKPYVVKGAGIDHIDLETFAAHGGNSFRTWAVDDGAEPPRQLLDRAHALGLTVSLGLEFAAERHGFDYDDAAAVAKQKEETRARVMAHKDHPALLSWIIGNELNNHYTNPRVFDAVNDVSIMIHEIDPYHPTTTALANADKAVIKEVNKRAGDLDFISFQVYGALFGLHNDLKKAKFKRPYFVTEWGAVGHWEVWNTRWGAPVENSSSEKAANYAKGYVEAIEPYRDQGIGNYVFLWGQKQERTPTWYGMFTDDGSSTEAVDVMHFIWNNQWPANRAPRVSPISLNGKVAFDNVTLWHGKDYTAKIAVMDYENDPISYRWEVRHESSATEVGGDQEEIPELVEGLIADPGQQEITLTAPQESGAYRLFVYASDGNNHTGHANIPFYVK